jgi:death-on-curing protein
MTQKKRRKAGRPTMFDVQLEMAKLSWAPVLEYLALVTDKSQLEDIPADDDIFHIGVGEKILEYEKIHPKEKIKWLTGKQIKKIHDDMINTFGGELGISDESRLDSLIDRAKNTEIFGQDPYETVIHKAAFLMHQLLRYHQFIDGQKRTGISTAFIFLGLNGYTLWSRSPIEEFHYCIDVAEGKYEVGDITEWISDRIASSDVTRYRLNIIKTLFPFADSINFRCTKCHAFLSPRSFRIKCKKCGTEFDLRLKNVVFTNGINGITIKSKFGLRRIDGVQQPH